MAGSRICGSLLSIQEEKMKRKFIRDQTGEAYIDVAITVLIIFTLTASLMALYPIFTVQQSLNQTAKYMARTVELYGKADDETLASVTESESFIEPDSISIDTEWEDAAEKTIQLKTPFTLTITKTVSIVILRPALGDPVTIDVLISASANGISEVYWK
jgi:Flp pilus assembly protein TadG